MEPVKTYEQFAGTSEKTAEKVAEYIAYLKSNPDAKKAWEDKFKVTTTTTQSNG